MENGTPSPSSHPHNEAKDDTNATTIDNNNDTSIANDNDVHQTINDSMDGTSFIDEQGTIIITEEQFHSVPVENRGRCRLDHVQNVASFIYEEVMTRYSDGYRGKYLAVERQQIAKYSGSIPGLYAVLMNHSLWRDIVATLQYLGFVRLDNSDGTLIMTGAY